MGKWDGCSDSPLCAIGQFVFIFTVLVIIALETVQILDILIFLNLFFVFFSLHHGGMPQFCLSFRQMYFLKVSSALFSIQYMLYSAIAVLVFFIF